MIYHTPRAAEGTSRRAAKKAATRSIVSRRPKCGRGGLSEGCGVGDSNVSLGWNDLCERPFARNVWKGREKKAPQTRKSDGNARGCRHTGSSVAGSRSEAAEAACGIVILLAEAPKASAAE